MKSMCSLWLSSVQLCEAAEPRLGPDANFSVLMSGGAKRAAFIEHADVFGERWTDSGSAGKQQIDQACK